LLALLQGSPEFRSRQITIYLTLNQISRTSAGSRSYWIGLKAMDHQTKHDHTISVIIPCYNAEPFLAEAIESALKQSRPVMEVIVVDDGSTDRSAEIARSCGAAVIPMKRNCGRAAASNAGACAARGDLLAWLDADDYWDSKHCEVVCGLLEQYPEAAVAYPAARLIGTKSGIFYTSPPRDREPFEALWTSFLELGVVNWVIWRSHYFDIGGFDNRIRFASDFDFFLRLSEKYRFIATSEVTGVYRWHLAQMSSSAADKQLRSVYDSRYRFLQIARERGNAELARLIEEKMLVAWDSDIRNNWWNPEGLRTLLAVRSLAPGRLPVSLQMRLRARLPARAVRQFRSARMRLKLRTRVKRIAGGLRVR
jgi:glycosyltransferase involved in cell wall biosynthesis